MRPLAILAVLASVMLAACGSDNDKEKTVVVNPPPETEVAPPPQTNTEPPPRSNMVIVPGGGGPQACPPGYSC
jgi:hypothetical protein